MPVSSTPSSPSHASGVMTLLLRSVILGLLGSLRMAAEGSSSTRKLRQDQEPLRRSLDVFSFQVPWGLRGRLRQAPCRGGVNKQQVIKHDKR